MKLKDVSRLYEIGMFNGKYDKEHANEHFINGIETVMEVLNDIPDIDPESLRPTGEWVKSPTGYGMFTCGGNPVYKCSECGYVYGSFEIYPSAKYCRDCGARMVKPNEK